MASPRGSTIGPELLFRLRKVDEKDLIAKVGSGLPLSKKGPGADKAEAAEKTSSKMKKKPSR